MPPLRDEPSARVPRGGRLLRALARAGRRSLPVAPVLLASLLLAVLSYGKAIEGPPARGQGARIEAGGVQLGGHVAGLYPGSVKRLRVYVQNPGPRPVTVGSIWAEVADARRRCAARNLTVSPFRGRLRVPPQRRRWVRLTISMRPNASNACRHGRFPLAYRARVRG